MRNVNHRKMSCMIMAVLMTVLSGCAQNPGVKNHFWEKKNNLESFRIFCSRDANNDTPVALDLVFIYNDLLTGELLKMDADSWFKTKSDFSLKFRNGFDVMSYEVVPLSETDTVTLPGKHRKALSIIMFTKYLTKAGSTPADMTVYKKPLIRLEKDNYIIVEE